MNKLKELREKKNKTQEEIAQAANVSVATVSRWESGEFSPRTDKLQDIARCLDCRIDDLFA